MGWTIAQHGNGIWARKAYTKDRKQDITNWGSNNFILCDTQPLQDEETLSLEATYALLTEIIQDNDNAYLYRGMPIEAYDEERGLYSKNSSNFLDIASRQFQLDLDFRDPSLDTKLSLEDRVEVALKHLPFLEGCRFIAQLSSSCGIGLLVQPKIKEYRRRLCLRLWVEAERAYTGAELSHYFKNYIDADLVDSAMFEPSRIHYVLPGTFGGKPLYTLEESIRLYA